MQVGLGVLCSYKTKMAVRIRNENWQEDEDLREDLKAYVSRNYRQREILDILNEQYPMYAWSMRTLSRRLQFFDIRYVDYDTGVDEVQKAVEAEMKGPGRLLGYRALHKKVRESHELKVPRNLVYDVLADVNPEGLEARGGVGKPKRPERNKAFVSGVSNDFLHIDIL